MMGVAENIQACLRIFRRAQHLWLVRDILHLPQGVFYVFVLWHTGPIRLIRGKKKNPSSGVLPSRQSVECRSILAHLLRRCTRLLMVLPSRQQSAHHVL